MTWKATFLLSAVCIGVFYYTVYYYVEETPVVYMAWPSKDCIRVQGQGPAGCEDLPDKYVVKYIRGRHGHAD